MIDTLGLDVRVSCYCRASVSLNAVARTAQRQAKEGLTNVRGHRIHWWLSLASCNALNGDKLVSGQIDLEPVVVVQNKACSLWRQVIKISDHLNS